MNSIYILKVKIGLLMMLLSMAFISTSCDDDDKPQVSTSTQEILAQASSQAVPVTIKSNTLWEATSDATWCRISPASGRGTTDVSVMLDLNTTNADRSATIKIKTTSGDVTSEIKVNQLAANVLLLTAPDSLTVGNQGGTVAFAVAANSDWSVTSSADWAIPQIKSGNGNNTVRVDVAANTSHFENRKAVVSIIAQDGQEPVVREFTIMQVSRTLPVISVGQENVTFDAVAQTKASSEVYIPVLTNISGTIHVSSQFSWCTTSLETIGGNQFVKISTESDNSDNKQRDCIVTILGDVNGEAVTTQVKVTQAGVGSPVLTLFREAVALDCNAHQQQKVGFYSPAGKMDNITAVSDHPKWIQTVKVDKTNNIITFSTTANTGSETRVGSITITGSLGNETLIYTITVTQDGVGDVDVTVSPAEITLGALTNLVGYTTVSSQTNFSNIVAISSDATWLNVTDGNNILMTGSASQSKSIKMTAQPNAGNETRTATVTITVSYGNQIGVRTVSVTQAGLGTPNVTLMPSVLSLNNSAHTGATVALIVSDQTTIRVQTSDAWISNPQYSATNSRITFSVGENRDEAMRSGIINVYATRDGETVVYPVTVQQLGLGAIDVRVAPASLTFSSSAHQPGAVMPKVIATAMYSGATIEATITSGEEWITSVSSTLMKSVSSSTAVYGINFALAANTDAYKRTGTITLRIVYGNRIEFRTITVVQNGLGAPAISTDARAYMRQDQTSYTRTMWLLDGDKTNVQYKVTFTSNQSAIEGDKGWITDATVNATTHQLNIKATPNTYDEERYGTVTIVAKRGTASTVQTVLVSQAGHKSPGVIAPDDKTLFVGSAAHDGYSVDLSALNGSELTAVSVNQTSNGTTWEGTNWLTGVTVAQVGTTNEWTLTYNVADNNEENIREGVIVIKASNGHSNDSYVYITVRQDFHLQAGINNLPEEIEIGAVELSLPINFSLRNNSTWSATVSEGTDWLNIGTAVNPTGATIAAAQTGTVLYFAATANATSATRHATITMTAKNGASNDQTYTIKITQLKAQEASVSGLPVNVMQVIEAAAGSKSITYSLAPGTTYTNITTSPTGSWLTATNAGNVITYTTTENTASTARYGVIYVTATSSDNSSKTYAITVKQEAATKAIVTGLPNKIEIGSAAIATTAGNQIPFTAADAVTAEASVTTGSDWLKIGATAGAATGTQIANKVTSLFYSATANTATSERVGVVTVLINRGLPTEQTHNIYVHQAAVNTASASGFPISDQIVQGIGHDGTELLYSVSSGMVTNVTSNVDWLTFNTAQNGTYVATLNNAGGIDRFFYKAADNPVTSNQDKLERQGNIYVTVQNGESTTIYCIPVKQIPMVAPELKGFSAEYSVGPDYQTRVEGPYGVINNYHDVIYTVTSDQPAWLTSCSMTSEGDGTQPKLNYTVLDWYLVNWQVGGVTKTRTGNLTIRVIDKVTKAFTEYTVKVTQRAGNIQAITATMSPSYLIWPNSTTTNSSSKTFEVSLLNNGQPANMQLLNSAKLSVTDNNLLPPCSNYKVTFTATSNSVTNGKITGTITASLTNGCTHAWDESPTPATIINKNPVVLSGQDSDGNTFSLMSSNLYLIVTKADSYEKVKGKWPEIFRETESND